MNVSRRPHDSPRQTSARGPSPERDAYEATVLSLAATEKPKPRRFPMRQFAHIALAVVCVLAVIGGFAAWSMYRASQQIPEFYVKALEAEPAKQAVAGEELERQALALHNQVRRPGQWEARFTQDQINGWLAVDLPKKFPGSLPVGASEPRVALSPDVATLAVKWRRGNVTTVLSLEGEAYLTEQPNEVAIRIRSVRAGALPVPLAQFLDKIATRASSSGIPLRWTDIEGDPVAIVNLPLDQPEFRGKHLVLEELRLDEGALIVAGRTDSGTSLSRY
jgi:hypothetical protein